MKKKTLPFPAAQALMYLLDLAAHGAGYCVRGTSGWATAADVERGARIWSAGEVLRAQAQRGRVLREDVRVCGETGPRWVYRLAQAGVDALAEAVGVWPVTIRNPGVQSESRVLIPEGCVVALEALRAAAQPGVSGRHVWFEGEPEWRSSRELTTELAREDEAAGRSYRWFTSEDLAWLVSRGLAEPCIVGRRTPVYRITPAGLQVQWLEWRDRK